MQEDTVVDAMVDFYEKEIAFDLQGYMQSKDGDVQMYQREPQRKGSGSVLERPRPKNRRKTETGGGGGNKGPPKRIDGGGGGDDGGDDEPKKEKNSGPSVSMNEQFSFKGILAKEFLIKYSSK